MSRVIAGEENPLGTHAEVGAWLLYCRQREECLEIGKPSAGKEMMQREPWGRKMGQTRTSFVL